MKKLLSFFMAFILIFATAFCVPFNASAEENVTGMYNVTDTVYADAYMLINLDDDSYPVIAEKNSTVRKYPASLTKIVTAIVTINNVEDIKASTTVSRFAVESLYGTGAQVAGLEIGEEITIEQLLYLTMVHSACDACQVLAEYVAGSVNGFVDMMNKWVEEIGCFDTHFVNADGLHDDNHYTTASDMAKITLEAMKSELFNTISSTQQYQYGKTNFVHTNFMLDKFHVSYYYEYASGIKTGSTEQAGYCVITKASKDGYNYLAIVMDSPIKMLNGYDTKCSFIDAKTLFEWAFNGLKYATIIRQNEAVEEVPVNNGRDADTVLLVAKEDITTLVPVSFDSSAVYIKPVDMPESLDAPVTQGDEICDAEIYFGDQVIAKVTLVAAKTVKLSTFLTVINAIKKFFSNKIVLTIVFVLIIAIIAYLLMFISRAKKNKKRIAEKRRRQQQLDEELNRQTPTFHDIEPPKK